MVAMSEGVSASISAGGGAVRALSRRILAQESLFLTRFTSEIDGAWVSLAPSLPGDLLAVENPETGLIIQSGSFLAADASIELRTNFGGVQRMLGKEGAFIVKSEGYGDVLLSAYGGIQRFDLERGQRITLDTGHFVASDGHMRYQLGILEGIVVSALSKEGLIATFEGPGSVYAQTRSAVELRSLLFPHRPQNEG